MTDVIDKIRMGLAVTGLLTLAVATPKIGGNGLVRNIERNAHPIESVYNPQPEASTEKYLEISRVNGQYDGYP